MRILPVAALALTAVVATSCEKQVKAPFDQGVCYAMSTPDGGEPQFNVVARDQPQIEFCAARLEEMRLNFNGMGGNTREVIGSYQGQFIFVEPKGVSFGPTLTGVRYFALARSGDGRLVVPGAIEQAPAQTAPTS